MISSCVRIEYPLPKPEQKKMNNKLAVILTRKSLTRIACLDALRGIDGEVWSAGSLSRVFDANNANYALDRCWLTLYFEIIKKLSLGSA
jgi:hypothetical protein